MTSRNIFCICHDKKDLVLRMSQWEPRKLTQSEENDRPVFPLIMSCDFFLLLPEVENQRNVMRRSNTVDSVLVNEKVVPVCLYRSSEGVDRQGLNKVLPIDHPYVASGKQTLIHSLFFQSIKIVFFRSRLKNIFPPIGGWNIL